MATFPVSCAVILAGHLLLSVVPRGEASDWYVSWSGVDKEACGVHPGFPCRTIAYVTSRPGDTYVIHVDGTDRDVVYDTCTTADDVGHSVSKSITIKGNGGIPRIGCYHMIDTFAKFFFHGDRKVQVVSLIDIQLDNAVVEFKNVKLLIRNCTFRDVSVRTGPGCDNIHVMYENSTFVKTIGCHDAHMCERMGDHKLFCRTTNVNLLASQFLDTKVNVQATYSSFVVANGCKFVKKLTIESGFGGLNATLPMRNGSLFVTGCEFRDMIHVDPILSAINIEAAALRVESIGNTSYNETHAYVTVEDSTFSGNERAMSVSRPFLSVRVSRCTFERNMAMHAAAAIRLAMHYDAKAVIRDSVFRENSAGITTHRSIPGRFDVHGDQVRVNSDQYKGVISLVGKGGSVRIQKGDVIFVNCTFLNNTARLLGGAIFVDRKSKVTVVRSYFENTDRGLHATQGDVFYSNGHAKLRSCTFLVKTAEDHVTILRHSGDHWSMNVEGLWFQCPVGHRLLMINTTSHRIIHDVGLKRSHKLDQLSYYCQTCGENQYSMDFGHLNYTLMNNATEYFTLLINGEEPFRSHSVNYVYGNITCHECPYGAACDHGIRAVPNFWGYVEGEYAAFQHCPPDYCCSDTKCSSIASCAEHRHGRLCGRCDPGFSEAMFSAKCVPDESCRHHWIWPLTLGMGVLYGLFLVFQNDLRDFLFSWPAKKRHPCCTWTTGLCRINLKSKKCVVEEDLVMDVHDAVNGKCHGMEPEGEEDAKDDDPKPEDPAQPTTGHGGGFLITLFYYFQDALLLHVDTVYTRTVSKVQKQIKSLLLGLFRFRLDFYQFLDDVCPFSGLTPVTKEFVKTLFVPYMLCVFGIFYLLFKWGRIFGAKADGRHKCEGVEAEKPFSTKLAAGFILAYLFTYQKLATSTFTLLNCVPVANDSVLYIDGTYTCFQLWQYCVMAYAFTCVLPFSIILMVGPPLLKHKYISLPQFFFGCMVPLPALMYWALTCRRRRSERHGVLSDETLAVYEILQGPFKDSNATHLLGQLCWSGVLIGRRLILFLCFTFINSVLIRLLCMLAVCFIILLHHVYVQPYKGTQGNLAGALSAAALLIVGGINLLRAGFESAEYVPQGPNRFLMEVFEEIENVLLLWLPLVGMCIIALVFLFRLLYLFTDKCYSFCTGEVQTQEEEIPTHL